MPRKLQLARVLKIERKRVNNQNLINDQPFKENKCSNINIFID